MGSALFVAFSAAFFIVYNLVADALGVTGTSTITAINNFPHFQQGGSFWDDIFTAYSAAVYPFIIAWQLFSRFFQLLTFQTPGMESASIVTAIIFIPLTFANGMIIFRALRGS